MANRTFYQPRSYGSGRVYGEFLFTAPGAGTSVAQSAIDGGDIVASITHVGGTNLVTVTLKDTFNKVIHLDAQVLGTIGGRATCSQPTNEGTANPISFGIYTWVAAGTAANDSASVIQVSLALRNGNWGVK